MSDKSNILPFKSFADLNAHLKECRGCVKCEEQVDSIGNYEKLTRSKPIKIPKKHHTY